MPNELEGGAANTRCSTGLDQGLSVLLAYLFGWASGFVFLFLEKDNHFVRFHAAQSAVLNLLFAIISLVFSGLSLVPVVGQVFSLLMYLVLVGLTLLIIMVIVKAYQQQMVKLPLVGGLAERLAKTL
jgi:uncharacterized membrane protein